MVLPIIFNLQRRRRTEGWGPRLVDRLTETKTGREMKGEKFENGRDKKKREKKTDQATTKGSGKATRLIRKMLLSPLNRASL